MSLRVHPPCGHEHRGFGAIVGIDNEPSLRCLVVGSGVGASSDLAEAIVLTEGPSAMLGLANWHVGRIVSFRPDMRGIVVYGHADCPEL